MELYRLIRQLKVELDWPKKISTIPAERKRQLIKKDNNDIPLTRRCLLLSLLKSAYYYTSIENDNYKPMRLIDR